MVKSPNILRSKEKCFNIVVMEKNVCGGGEGREVVS